MNEGITTLADVRSALESGTSSEEGIADAAFARIARANGKRRAFIAFDAERAQADTRHIDGLRKPGVKRGPLAGAPIGATDIVCLAGQPIRAGSVTRSDGAIATQNGAQIVGPGLCEPAAPKADRGPLRLGSHGA